MDEKRDLLFELGCAELPAKGLNALSINLAENIKNELNQAELTYGDVKVFATPRRVAVIVHNLITQQPDRQIEKRGPALTAPQGAKEGFAKSCQTTVDQLQKLETAQGVWLIHKYTEKGKKTIDILPQLIKQALSKLNLTKNMRWGNGDFNFIRPVQWVLFLFGKDVVDAEIFGVKSGRNTYGHRFHHSDAILIDDPGKYEKTLENEGKVIADFEKRKDLIFEQANKIAQQQNYKAIIDQELLFEVTGLVEWPNVVMGQFDQRFIKLPKEVLVVSMQHHQKSFPVVDSNDEIKPYFITVSNIDSKDIAQVIEGNKRVIQARLSDAEFFYETDHKRSLQDYVNDLKNVVFQHKLGNSYERSLRIARLAKLIAGNLNIDIELAEKAGLYCKADLMTNMVGEFPELQGIMGYYYALREFKESSKDETQLKKYHSIAVAIRDHYLPRYSCDHLPESHYACAIALADRFDAIVGLFGINQPPTGEKDPFGLRRAAISILRIIIEKQLNVNLFEIIEWAIPGYNELPNEKVKEQVHEFILDRLRALYVEQGILPDTLAAVVAVQNLFPLDINHRLHAVQAFRQLPEASVLSLANKRATNILEKSEVDKSIFADNAINKIQPHLFEKPEEQSIYDMLLKKNVGSSSTTVETQSKQQEYTDRLRSLAELYKPVNDFFDTVMVNVEDEKIRQNRLLLVAAMRQLFLQVADISLLQI